MDLVICNLLTGGLQTLYVEAVRREPRLAVGPYAVGGPVGGGLRAG